MTPPDPNEQISASAIRQLLGAASDAGIGSIISPSSVHSDDGKVVVITIGRGEVRALSTWLTNVADSHQDTPILAIPTRDIPGESGGKRPWMRDVTDVQRATPVGYEKVNIPVRNDGGQQ